MAASRILQCDHRLKPEFDRSRVASDAGVLTADGDNQTLQADDGLCGDVRESRDAVPLPPSGASDLTVETWEDVRPPGGAGPLQEIGLGWRGWVGSALFHAGLVAIGVAIVVLGEPPVPLPSDTIAVTLALEPSAPVSTPPAEIPPPLQESPPEAVTSAPENPPPAASEPLVTPAPPLPEPEPSAAAPPEPAPVPQPPPEPRRTARPRTEPRPPPPRKREPAVAPSAAPSAPTAALQPQPSPAPAANQEAFAPLIPARPVSGLASNRKPDYPIEARSRRQQGRVLLRVQVSATGDAASVEIVKSSGHPSLDQAARAAVRTWRFVPATRAGMAVAGSADVPIEFRMDE